jgi:hypothetical protein
VLSYAVVLWESRESGGSRERRERKKRMNERKRRNAKCKKEE